MERVFPLHSPNIKIEVARGRGCKKSKVVFFLRDRKGKAARIRAKYTSKQSHLANQINILVVGDM